MGKYNLRHDQGLSNAKKQITYLHGIGEDTALGVKDVDMVSMCLVAHELPQSASRDVFKEVYRILPNGGVFSFMDMDPLADNFKKFASNPFAFAAFKSTEPWIREYVSMDIIKELQAVGFSYVGIKSNSPRHRTVVAIK